MLLRRKPCTRENPTIIRTFALGSAMPISSATRKTAGLESTTASSIKLSRDRLSHPCHVNIFCETTRRRAKQVLDPQELAQVKTQQPIASEEEQRVLKFRPRTLAHPPDRRGGPPPGGGRKRTHST